MQLSKRQLQILVVGGVVGAALLFAGIKFFVVPLIDGWKKDVAETVEIRDRLAESWKAVRSKPELKKQLEKNREQIAAMSEHIPLPVLRNYLLEMDNKIRTCAANMEIKINGIDDYDIQVIPGNSRFKVYRIKVVMQTGLRDLLRFFNNLEQTNLFVCVSALSIAPRETTPEKHAVSCIIGWLIWSDPDNRPEFAMRIQEE